MRVVIAMDSFKGSLSSIEAGKAVAEGVRRGRRHQSSAWCALWRTAAKARLQRSQRACTAKRCVFGSRARSARRSRRNTASKATSPYWKGHRQRGLPLVPQDKRNPMKTTTYGVGEMLRDAINRVFKRFILGIGGSATE